MPLVHVLGGKGPALCLAPFLTTSFTDSPPLPALPVPTIATALPMSFFHIQSSVPYDPYLVLSPTVLSHLQRLL